ncbi:MAG: lysophospholipase [Clostridiales bacterium]|nr:lysophospholipase [Clostridiales bacterium]
MAFDEKQIKLENYRRLNRFAKKGQILFAGSSLMEQFPVHELLMDEGLPLTVYNRGIGGYTTPELDAALDTCVFALEPAYIYINIGTNDMNTESYALDGLIERYAGILSKIRARLPETGLCLLAYYPINDSVAPEEMRPVLAQRTNARIAHANEAVKALATRFGADWLDLNAGITDDEGRLKAEYTIEGMHIYADGYMQVLRALMPHLKAVAERLAKA